MKIDDRKTNYPYSAQCHHCENLLSEKKQNCKEYGTDVPDDFWTNKKDCPFRKPTN